MNTKKAIEFLETVRPHKITGMALCPDLHISYEVNRANEKKIDDIIDLLKRGEKLEQIWEEFKKQWVFVEANCISPYPLYDKCTIGYLLESFEQKYFPKRGSYFFEATSKDPHLKKISFASPNISEVRLLKPKKVIK